MVLAELQAPVAGAWLIMGLGAWVTARFDDDRRARVAVIGSPGFASDLAEELDAAGIRAYEVIGWFGRQVPGPDTPGVLHRPLRLPRRPRRRSVGRPGAADRAARLRAGGPPSTPTTAPIRIATPTR